MDKDFFIPNNKSVQFQYENQTWERLLEFLKQENAYLKNRLSEVLDHNTNKDFLPQAEHYQNLFIVKDEFMDEMRHDVHEQGTALKKVSDTVEDTIDIKLVKMQEKLRNEMEFLEKDFIKIKNEFNKYLLAVG